MGNKMTIRTTKSSTIPIIRRVLLCSVLGLLSRGAAATLQDHLVHDEEMGYCRIDRRRLGLLSMMGSPTLKVTGDDTVDETVKGSYTQDIISGWWSGHKTVTFTKDSGSFLKP